MAGSYRNDGPRLMQDDPPKVESRVHIGVPLVQFVEPVGPGDQLLQPLLPAR